MNHMDTRYAKEVCTTTLSYHRALGIDALTSSEVWYWQVSAHLQPTALPLSAVRGALKELRTEGHLCEQNGFWGVDTQGCAQRIRATGESVQKWRALASKATFLPYIPYVRHIRALGSITLANARPESDLDISIATSPRRLWLCRILVTASAHVLRRRRWGNTIQNRLCFNHYTARSTASYGTREALFERMEARAIPLWDSTNTPDSTHALRPRPFGLTIKRFIERAGDLSDLSGALESLVGRLQIARIAASTVPYPHALPPPSLDSSHLVFHYPKIEETKRKLERGTTS